MGEKNCNEWASAFQQRESQEDLFSPSSSCFYFLGSPPQGCGRRGAVITTHTISFTGAKCFFVGAPFTEAQRRRFL
jgi:hypothetical protein